MKTILIILAILCLCFVDSYIIMGGIGVLLLAMVVVLDAINTRHREDNNKKP